MLPPSRRDYGSVEDQQPGPSSRTRIARTRKYSEAVSGSVAKSISMVYPQFIATSYVNPPPSFSQGAMGGSIIDRIGVDTDSLLTEED